MIIAHLADLHLGFRAYGRVERGVDVRERDIAVAWERSVQEIVKLRPGLVIVAGDVFDRPDPPAGALVSLARGLELLRSSLPKTPVLMVAGPRDTPRRPGDPGALAVLDTFPNVEAAAGLPRSLVLEDLEVHASLVPYRAAIREPVLHPEPDPRARWNVLVLHATGGGVEEPAVVVDPSDWDYVALGGEHRRRRVRPGVEYPGALERVSLDPWDEATDEKGFLTVDLESGESRFHPIPGRAVAALAPIRVSAGDPDRLRRRVREVTEEVPGGIADKIVRLRLEGIEPADLMALQGELLHGLRQTALHLAVEAGREPRAPVELWSAADAPGLLRDAFETELEREGALETSTRELVRALVPGVEPDRSGSTVVGPLETVDGNVPGVGRVSTSVRPGLTAIMGGAGRSRRAVAELLLRTGGGQGGAVARLWEGQGGETLDGAMHRAVEAVGEARGLAVVTAALERAGDMWADEPANAGWEGEERRTRTSGPIRIDPEQVAAELRVAERELHGLRADAAEVDGDLEVATMDWYRERQDAETTLNAYRDRARELQARIRQMESAGPTAPCPTCGRVLESHYDEVLTELQDEWEGVVQDGSWWKLRWEQLEMKPDHLKDLEGRTLRLHAALEATSERAELLRARLSELGAEGGRPPVSVGGALGDVVNAVRRVREARLARTREVLLTRASRYLGRISGGRILAITWVEGGSQLQGDSGPLVPLSEEDLAAGRLAVRLAAVSLVAAGPQGMVSLVLEEPFDRLDAEAQLRTVALLRSLLREVERIVLVTRGDVVEARPELFETVLEVRDDAGSGAMALRPTPAGDGRLLLREPVGSAPSKVGR